MQNPISEGTTQERLEEDWLNHFQQDDAHCHKAQLISNWFLDQDNGLTVFQWPPRSPDISPADHFEDKVEEEIHINRCGTYRAAATP